MLIQFSIENHRSIKDSAVISFAASKDKSLESYLLHPDEKRALLPAIAIYGANAAGKSNVLHALMTMKDMVVGEAAKISKGQKLPWEPFGGTTTPTSFEIVFIYHGIRYAYGYSFDAKKIYTEYLYHWPNGREALIFSRENGVYEFRENINEQITLSNRTPDNKLYLVSSNDWNLPQTENAYKWFLEKLTFLMEEAPAASETVAQIVSGNEKKARILKELLLADLGISDVTIKTFPARPRSLRPPTVSSVRMAAWNTSSFLWIRSPPERNGSSPVSAAGCKRWRTAHCLSLTRSRTVCIRS